MSNDTTTLFAGSSPAIRTTFPSEIQHPEEICTQFAQNTARPADRRVRFPVTIRHRSNKATSYRPGGRFNYYRVAYTVAGKRRMRTFGSYPDARALRVLLNAPPGEQLAPNPHQMPIAQAARGALDSRCHASHRGNARPSRPSVGGNP